MAFVSLWVLGAFALDQQSKSNPNVGVNSSGEPAPLLHVNYQGHQAIFWTCAAIAVLVQSIIPTLIEGEGLWTVRFRLAIFEHYLWIGVAGILITSSRAMILSIPAGSNDGTLGALVLAFASFLVVFRYAWPAWRNRHFYENRWAAWSGPSRTGIAPHLVNKIGDIRTWQSMRDSAPRAQFHPVDKSLRWFLGTRSPLIDPDPTELLKVSPQSASPLDTSVEGSSSSNLNLLSGREKDAERTLAPSPLEEKDIPGDSVTPVAPPPLLPSSHSTLPDEQMELASNKKGLVPSLAVLRPLPAEGLFPPVKPGESASLFWGEHLGFSRRVSRGILGIPPRLLAPQPVADAGHNGQAMCLMHGVCARNKGLAPLTFLFKLDLTKFEENSAQWPRPSKVLRSYYRKEVEGSYGGLGDVFVKAATELALLFADSPAPIIKDWFEQVMEQQDLVLARQAYQLGATDEELSVLYRLSYATMLVSLACHAHGRRKRPEMTVFRAYCALNQRALPYWASSEEVLARVNEENAHVPPNADLEALVHAVLPKASPPSGPLNPGGRPLPA